MDRDSSVFPSVAAAAVAVALRRAATAGRTTSRVQASFAETALWRAVSISDGPGVRNRAWAAMVDGPLDTAALRRALADLIARHDVLRTGYLDDGERLLRTTLPQRWVRMPVDDFSNGPRSVKTATATLWAQRQASRAIELAQAPLMRLGVARFATDLHALVLVTHRLVADRFSQALLLRELGERYAVQRAAPAGIAPPLEPAPAYADWAQAQRDRVESAEYAPVRQWWSHRLQGVQPLALRADRPRSGRPSFAGARVPIRLDAARAKGLRALAWNAGVTPFVVLLSVWQLVLSQHTGQTDLLVATPVSNRERPGTDRVVGVMTDQLPLRLQLDGLHDIGALLNRNRAAVRDAAGLRGAPWGHIAADQVARVAFSMRAPPVPVLELAGCAALPLPLGDEPCFHELSLHLEPHGDEFEGALAYASELFEPATAERIAGYVGGLLDAVLARPDAQLAELPRMPRPGPSREAVSR